ncbi:hypothetical protein GUITHDRAFT_135647 [Guillardia theta CCMP2712]|uniref:Uncharacterized protein n=1 Tax=Guillardia theta (strain CCMP2712) TaxID=905079 RepID=L1JNV6_GUITC|nr:hypothetical protein GUITHDRAFT_135647 [Guillardia theta CCMP2712]EKX49964.1 hypothetical protein GUITHDRAFT_135647 [Guillardia theta CCMP2712]|eukprot:XP_005836944.1 hypothetical protein GUITHDRAFT_135647 [Guillardia theta CCMP2712]
MRSFLVLLVTSGALLLPACCLNARPLLVPSSALRLRGGSGVLQNEGSTYQALSSSLAPQSDMDDIDKDIFLGDLYRLQAGEYDYDPQEMIKIEEMLEEESARSQLLQQFMMLQDIRLEAQMPGGDNCSYADSWFAGSLWDDPDDEFSWTRSAWMQCQRATCWREMPPVWKRMVKQQWEELQEFVAALCLPDKGVKSARYLEFQQEIRRLQIAFAANVNRVASHLEQGSLKEEVTRKAQEAEKITSYLNEEPRAESIFSWVMSKTGHIIRKAFDAETEEDKINAYRPTDVQLFGISLFNTKDPLSDRLWNMGSSQGDTITAWPLKAAAWVAKKLEREGILPSSPKAPLFSETHSLLNTTKVQQKLAKGEIDLRKFNALDYLHDYAARNFEHHNDTWHEVKEDFELEHAMQETQKEESEFPLQTIFTLEELEAAMTKKVPMVKELVFGQPEPSTDEMEELISNISSLEIAEPREQIQQLFATHAGGEVRIVAKALDKPIPSNISSQGLDGRSQR